MHKYIQWSDMFFSHLWGFRFDFCLNSVYVEFICSPHALGVYKDM